MTTDFALALDGSGRPAAALGEADPLFNAVILSLHIERGAWFFNPDFGFPRDRIKTTSNEGIALAKQAAESALSWIIDAKLAKKIEVFVTSHRREWLNFRIVLDNNTTYKTTLAPWDRPPDPPVEVVQIIDELPGRTRAVPVVEERELAAAFQGSVYE